MEKQTTILIVEDDQSANSAICRLLGSAGYRAISAEGAEEAAQHLDSGVDLVLSDVRLGPGSGLDLLKLWHSRHPTVPFVLMTAYGEIAAAVTAMKLGANDFLTKPIHADQLLLLVRQCLADREQAEVEPDRGPSECSSVLEGFVGQSPAMCAIFSQIRRAARSESTILILGESGTGKELVAQSIHLHSPRRSGPFIAVNMAAVPETLIESELFGHAKGSFTGAAGNRLGKLQAAQGGTVFIDEIGDFALASQAKLLRVLETRTVTPVGSEGEKSVDVRVVAATSRNLDSMIADGSFRDDLFYRLSVVTLTLPPLRERLDDVPLLTHHFLAQLCRDNGRPTVTVDPELMRFLQTFEWPGNVRQLRNCLESMVVMSDASVLTVADLPHHLMRAERPGSNNPAPTTTIEDLEKSAILQALDESSGNRTRAAEVLGISVRTLQRRLQRWGIGPTPQT